MKLIRSGEEKIMQEYKEKLPQYLEGKLQKLSDKLATKEEVHGLSSIEINELLRLKSPNVNKVKYTAEQLKIVFDYYREALVVINQKFKYPPTKENFCAFAGISTSTYNQYLISSDEEKQEVMLMIDDYIRENMLTSAQIGETKERTAIFRGKTAHGLVEASAPIVIEHKSEIDISKINSMIEAIKAGKSLKNIELKKSDYKVEK